MTLGEESMSFIKILTMGVVLFTGQALLANINQNVPSMNPTSTCKAIKTPNEKSIRDYRYLNSDNCQNIFVLPEEIGTQHINYEIVEDLDFCKAVKTATKRILATEEMVSSAQNQLKKIMDKPATTDSEIIQKEKEIANKQKDIAWLNDEVTKQLNRRDQNYGDIPGARFSIFNDNRVIEEELNSLVEANRYPVIVQEPNKEPEIFYKDPGVAEALITDSYYTFFIHKAKEREQFASIIHSDVPAKVHSESRRYGIAHVEGGNALPADMTLNLPSICIGAFQDGNGEWDLKDNRKNPIFTITRTFEVMQRAAYGYSAALKIEAVVDRLMSHIKLMGNDAFTVDDVFLDAAVNDLSSYLSFEWSQQHGPDGENLSKKRIKEMKLNLLAGYLENYFDQLIKLDILKVAGFKEAGTKDGGFVSSPNTKLNCFKSPLTRSCHVEAYKLTDSNITDDAALKASLTVNQSFAKNVGVNNMEPILYRSLFQPIFYKQ